MLKHFTESIHSFTAVIYHSQILIFASIHKIISRYFSSIASNLHIIGLQLFKSPSLNIILTLFIFYNFLIISFGTVSL
jgi:hypothetical protein